MRHRPRRSQVRGRRPGPAAASTVRPPPARAQGGDSSVATEFLHGVSLSPMSPDCFVTDVPDPTFDHYRRTISLLPAAIRLPGRYSIRP